MLWKVEYADGRGRALVADKVYRPGHVILEQEPYEAVLYDDQASTRSHLTFKECDHSLRCGGCKQARYANREEQRAAWAEGHKEECRALATCAPRVPPPTVRLAARVLWKLIRLQRLGNETGGNSYKTIMELQDHWEKIDDSRKQSYAQMAVLTREYMQPSTRVGDLPQARDIVHLLARFACNNHTICDEEQRPIGALINHSCKPNAVQSFKGGKICFRAVQNIAAGAEVCISYIELAATRQERRQALLEGYYFDIDAGHVVQVDPVAVLRGVGSTPTVKIFPSPPWKLDAKDEQLTALETPEGRFVADSGIAAHWLPQAVAADDGFELDDDDEDKAAAKPSSSKDEQEVLVECWGPVFLDGQEVKEGAASGAARVLADLLRRHKAAEGCMAAGRVAEACGHLTAPDPDGQDMEAISGMNVGNAQQPHTLHPASLNIWRMRVEEVRMRVAIAQELWDEALEAAQKLTPFYRMVYPKVWPLLGLHFAAIVKLAALMGDDATTAGVAAHALQVLQYTHPGSRITSVIVELQHNVQREMEIRMDEIMNECRND